MTEYLQYFLGGFVWFFILGVALWRGETPERLVAGVRLAAILATPIVQSRPITNSPDLAVLLVDLAVLATMFYVALRSDRWWPIFCAAFFLVAIGIHIIKATRPDTSQYVYVTSRVAFAYLALFAQAAGIIEVELRRRRGRRSLLHQGH